MHLCCCNELQPQEDSGTQFKIPIGLLDLLLKYPEVPAAKELSLCAFDDNRCLRLLCNSSTSKEKCCTRYEYTPEQQIFNKQALLLRNIGLPQACQQSKGIDRYSVVR